MNDNEANTTVVDSIGTSNGTSQQNTSVLHTSGKINGALSFNGVTDYIDTNSTFESVFQNDFSISVWIKPKAYNPDAFHFKDIIGAVVEGLGGNTFRVSHELAPDERTWLVFYYTASFYTVNFEWETTFIGPNIWFHVVVTIAQIDEENVVANIYINADLVISTGTTPCVLSTYSQNSKTMWIGNSNGDNDYSFDGEIDNLMLFNDALTQDNVDFLYNNGNGTENLTSSSIQPMKYYYDLQKKRSED
jgi:hypothetical protein